MKGVKHYKKDGTEHKVASHKMPKAATGERYLPAKAIKSLTSAEYSATTKAKRKGTAEGKQFVRQPTNIAKKTAKFRRGV